MKGQAALEFVSTYGWAVLAVLVALGTLAYFGVFDVDLLLPEKCLLSGSSGLFCEDFTATQQGIALRLRNVLKEDIIVSSITISSPQCIFAGQEFIEPDGYQDFGLVCAPAQDASVNAEFIVQYRKGEAGLDRAIRGVVVKHDQFQFGADAEICQNAEDAGLCDWLDFAYGPGYQESCCQITICCG